MNHGHTVLAQLTEFLSHNEFNRCVARYAGNHRVRRLSCWDQFLAMVRINGFFDITSQCQTSPNPRTYPENLQTDRIYGG